MPQLTVTRLEELTPSLSVTRFHEVDSIIADGFDSNSEDTFMDTCIGLSSYIVSMRYFRRRADTASKVIRRPPAKI